MRRLGLVWVQIFLEGDAGLTLFCLRASCGAGVFDSQKLSHDMNGSRITVHGSE